ncbi:MAG: L-threonylcarbamoyladenylate synthase [Halanaerobiales bacterium]
MKKYNTELYRVDYNLIEDNKLEALKKHKAVKEAAELLRNGEVVAFPTETVYGLGADATNEGAVERIYLAKGRPQDNPLIVHISTLEQLTEITEGKVSTMVKVIIDEFWPGPLTVILNKNEVIPDRTTAGLDSVAVRMPAHPLARALIEQTGKPIAAPSANISGAPSPTRAFHVMNDLKGRIPLILDGGSSWVGVESTVIDARNDQLVILRPGGISREEIGKVLDSQQLIKAGVKMDSGLSGEENGINIEKPRSPGMKYRHYSPETPLYIIESEQKLSEILDKGVDRSIGFILSTETYNKYQSQLDGLKIVEMGSQKAPDIIAAKLYDILRSIDKLSLESAYIESIPQEGIGEAVMNRISKASSRE